MAQPLQNTIPERVQKMIDLYESGSSLQVVGWAHGVSRERVRQLFARHGYTHRYGNGVRLEEALAAVATPGTRKEIAHRLGVSRASIGPVLKRHGLTVSFVGDKNSERKYTDDELLSHMRALARQLGRTPGNSAINAAPGPCHRLYYRYFGSLRAAQARAGLTPNRPGYRAASHV